MGEEQENLEKYVEVRKVVALISDLREDHQRLERSFDEVKHTASFYQTRFQAAEQIVKAARDGRVETPRFKPDFFKDKKYLETIRLLCKQAVYAQWNTEKQASTLLEIYRFVKAEIKQMISTGHWTTTWTIPGKRTIDRRTNEAADARYWPDGVTPIIAVKGGYYMPNPALFDGEVKAKLEALANAS